MAPGTGWFGLANIVAGKTTFHILLGGIAMFASRYRVRPSRTERMRNRNRLSMTISTIFAILMAGQTSSPESGIGGMVEAITRRVWCSGNIRAIMAVVATALIVANFAFLRSPRRFQSVNFHPFRCAVGGWYPHSYRFQTIGVAGVAFFFVGYIVTLGTLGMRWNRTNTGLYLMRTAMTLNAGCTNFIGVVFMIELDRRCRFGGGISNDCDTAKS